MKPGTVLTVAFLVGYVTVLGSADDKLVLAAREGRIETVEALIKAGADVNFKTPKYGFTALMEASGEGHTDIVKAPYTGWGGCERQE